MEKGCAQDGHGGVVGAGDEGLVHVDLGPNSIEKFRLEFWLEKSLEFWLEIPYTMKMFKNG